MKAVIYARYSSDNQREESIEGQLRECRAFAQKNDITVLRDYIDRAFSAKTDNRPAFQEMIKDSSKKLFDVIIVWKLDRFARNRYDSARYKAQLKKNGVKVISATEVISEGAEGIILESVRVCGILFRRSRGKSRARHDGKCAEMQIQRRQYSTRVLCGRGPASADRPADGSFCQGSL